MIKTPEDLQASAEIGVYPLSIRYADFLYHGETRDMRSEWEHIGRPFIDALSMRQHARSGSVAQVPR